MAYFCHKTNVVSLGIITASLPITMGLGTAILRISHSFNISFSYPWREE